MRKKLSLLMVALIALTAFAGTLRVLSGDVNDVASYQLTAGETENGSISFLVDGQEVTTATEGQVVTIKLTPAENYDVDEVTAQAYADYSDANASKRAIEILRDLTLDGSGTEFTLTMPGANVLVNATFKKGAKDITVTVADNVNVNDAITEAADGFIPKNLVINLPSKGIVSVSEPIEAAGSITINGNGAAIVANNNPKAFIQLSKTPAVDFLKNGDGSDSQYYGVNDVIIKNVAVLGVKGSIFYDNNVKYCVVNFLIDNSIFELRTEQTNNQAFIAFQGGGAKSFKMTNSTVYQMGAEENNYFLRYNNSARLDRYGFDKNTETQDIIFEKNTFYKVGKSGQWGNYNGIAGQKYSKFSVKDNIWVDCGNGQIARRLLGGRTASSYNTCEFNNNTYLFNGAAEEGNTSYDTGKQLTTDPGFANPEEGDFTVGQNCSVYPEQLKYQTGDPRWLKVYDANGNATGNATYNPGAASDPIILQPADGADLAEALNEAYNRYQAPPYVKIVLAPNAKYTISEPLEIFSALTITGSATSPATIDASQLSKKPLIQISSTRVPVVPTNNAGYYNTIYNVTFENFIADGLTGQFFYANKQKYVIPYFNVNNCIIRMEGASGKTIFDFNGGGYLQRLKVTNSTLSADAATTWSNGGLFSSQSGPNASQVGEIISEQRFTFSNNTIYNIATGKTTCTLRENSKNWMWFDVTGNIIINSGKQGQFIKGMNAGQNNATPNWFVQGNSFLWPAETVNGHVTIYKDVLKEEQAGASNCAIANNNITSEDFVTIGGQYVPGVAVENLFLNVTYDLQTNEIVSVGAEDGDFSLGACTMKTQKLGDPRWLTASLQEKYITTDMIDDDDDLAKELNRFIKAGFLKFRLQDYATYNVRQPIIVDKGISLKGKGVRIDASNNNGKAFILLNEEPVAEFLPKVTSASASRRAPELTDYYGIEMIELEGLSIKGVKNSFLYDNNVKYCVVDFKIADCVVELPTEEVQNEAIISFRAGGAKDFTMINSTFYGNGAVAKYFLRYNNSARLDRFGFDKNNDFESITLESNTFYALLKEDGQFSNYGGFAGQKYTAIRVLKNIFVNIGESQTPRRLLGGRNASSYTICEFDKNTYMKPDGTFESEGIAPDCTYDTSGSALTTNPGFKKVEQGDFTLYAPSDQNQFKTGDPRWFEASTPHYYEPTAIEKVDADKAADDGAWYTIQGVKVAQPAKGIYIHNGKKVIVK